MGGDIERHSDDGSAMELGQTVLQTMKCCQERNDPPLVWAVEVAKCVCSRGLGLPSTELGQLLVSHLCSNLNVPALWKFIDQALSFHLVSPLHVLSLLAPRILSHRHVQPEAYRLYLELVNRYVLSLEFVPTDATRDKIVKSVDASIQLSQAYGIQIADVGQAFVCFFFSMMMALIDSTMIDWGLQIMPSDRSSFSPGSGEVQQMDVDLKQNQNDKMIEHRERMRKTNSIVALEVLEKVTESRKATVLLRLIHLNMPEKFEGLLQRLKLLGAHKLVPSSPNAAEHVLFRLSANIRRSLDSECALNKRSIIGKFIDLGSCKVPTCSSESALSACWVLFDVYMESAMDAKQLPVTSAIDILTETIMSLQVLNWASWEETFLALWLSALRLVQRERQPPEGPIPHLEARLSILLSIVPLAIVKTLNDSLKPTSTSSRDVMTSSSAENTFGHDITASRTHSLIMSLQALGQFSELLCPPECVVEAANTAAAKAATVVSNSKNLRDGIGGHSHADNFAKAGGNMRHLIVEACIARKLIDTSAYLWPGYVPTASVILTSDSATQPMSPWSSFMEGSPLTSSLISSLVKTPATSFTEIEKLYHIALNGSEEEKPAAAKILCGASLSHGWSIQEHVVKFLVKLLSPPVPSTQNNQQSHLVAHIPMLSAILFGASSVDIVHILSLHGVVPEVAAALLPLCEAFGSLDPSTSSSGTTDDELSVYMVFSAAFLFLLRLWKFYRPPLELGMRAGEEAIGGVLTLEYLLMLRNSRITSASCDSTGEEAIGGVLTLEYLLMLRNSRITSASCDSTGHEETKSSSLLLDNKIDPAALDKQVYLDSFPKLRAWYCQNKICVASTLSGLSSGNPVHQVANQIIHRIYRKMTKNVTTATGNSTLPSGDSLSESEPPNSGEETYQRPLLPAWEMLEAIPFALESLLTACAYGKLSPRDLTTGLRDLVDFFPASVAAIISYFSAEVTRGIWKLVPMNGTDWPSPANALPTVTSEITKILGAVGVHVPSYPSDATEAMLPLPLAALVSLTITFKLDWSNEYILAVVGPALENCTTGSPWPSMPIVSSLWAQKIRRWHNFIVFSCSRSVFRHNKDAVVQLLRSCFTSFLPSSLHNKSSISGLLGSISDYRDGSVPNIAPGFLYLRSCGIIQDPLFISNIIVELVSEYSTHRETSMDKRLRSGQTSLSVASIRAKEVASLGSSLLCAAGGAQRVHQLYRESIPTWLLKMREDVSSTSMVSSLVEGYAMAYLVVLCGACAFGVREGGTPWALWKGARVVGVHMDFLAEVMEGNVAVGCGPATWKAYVSCLIGLVVRYAPSWVRQVKPETLGKLASGLRGWNECELAISLVERGGVPAMGLAAQLLSLVD